MTSEVRRIGGLRPPAEVTGPLAEHAAAFKQMLIGQGYARGTISAHLGLMSRVSRWLDVQGLPARALADLAEVDRFFAERRAKGCRLRITARSLVPLLDFLRDRQVIGAPVVPAATPAELLLAEYRTYLEQERAATAGTVVNFTKYAGIFLRTFPRLGTDAAQQADLAAALGRLTAAEVVTFVTGWASCRSPAYGQAMVYALRNLLRYLQAWGLLSHALAEAVPTVPGWKPPSGAGGDRRGKNRRSRCTPLTPPTVTTLASWLGERGGSPDDPLFPTRTGNPLSRDAVAHLLAKYVQKAAPGCPSLDSKTVTPHTLRHSAAMALVHAGIDPTVIALWMGHASVASTKPYIHADMTLKQQAADRLTPPGVKPGRYQAPDELLAFLADL